MIYEWLFLPELGLIMYLVAEIWDALLQYDGFFSAFCLQVVPAFCNLENLQNCSAECIAIFNIWCKGLLSSAVLCMWQQQSQKRLPPSSRQGEIGIYCLAELINSIEITIAIDISGTIAIVKRISQLLQLLLIRLHFYWLYWISFFSSLEFAVFELLQWV